jgi:uncharacterized protein YqgC (DUF456 family)
MEIVVTILVGLAMLVGLLGAILPGFPDVVLIWGAALGYGFYVGWSEPGIWFFVGITVLGLAGAFSEAWVSGAGARAGGASIRAVFAGLALGVISLLLTGPIGGVIGLLVGTYLAEYIRLRDAEKAAKAMLGMGLGCGASFGVKLLLGLGMVAAWVAWIIVG